jgi:hypothetical protein
MCTGVGKKGPGGGFRPYLAELFRVESMKTKLFLAFLGKMMSFLELNPGRGAAAGAGSVQFSGWVGWKGKFEIQVSC